MAEAAYALGILAMGQKHDAEALTHMQRAHALNPEHEDTTRQIGLLKDLIEAGREEAAS